MKYILFEKKEHTGIIKINNPDSLNALKAELLNELKQLIIDISSAKDIRVLVITGVGKAFAAGSDIKELQHLSTYEAKDYSVKGKAILDLIEKFPVPVISAINGYALGGGLELVLSTDFSYASNNAMLGLPELKLGLIPGFAGCKRLTDRIGLELAKEFIFTSKMLTAQEALTCGLVNKVTEPDKLMEEVFNTAEKIQRLSPNAVKEVKELLNACKNNTPEVVSEIETNKFGLIFSHPEAKEGIAAFINKNKK